LDVVPDPNIARANHSITHNGSGFQKYETCATKGSSTVVHGMEIRNASIIIG
jgi:hypothetical protein